MITVLLIFVAAIGVIMAVLYVLGYILLISGMALFNKFLEWLNS